MTHEVSKKLLYKKTFDVMNVEVWIMPFKLYLKWNVIIYFYSPLSCYFRNMFDIWDYDFLKFMMVFEYFVNLHRILEKSDFDKTYVKLKIMFIITVFICENL